MAVRYGTFRICVLRTSLLELYRTSVPYLSSIFEAYRTYVPYLGTIPAYRTLPALCRTSVQFLKRTVPAYRTLLFLRTLPSINLV